MSGTNTTTSTVEHQALLSLQKQQLPPLTQEEADQLLQCEKQKSLQPFINIGMIGHVAHGKTSLARAISGVATARHSIEKMRNRTVKLGYANFKIFKCNNMLCPPPVCYRSFGSREVAPKCSQCGSSMTLARHMSLVDCPGHETLMRTMLNGAAVMDSAILVIAANETVPQPQTVEHLAVAEIMNLNNIITIQNKVDLIKYDAALRCKDQISEFVDKTVAEKAPIIPMSCAPHFQCNVDVLLQYLVEKVPVPNRDLTAPPLLTIIRSFDVNKPGTKLDDLKGGVIGGTLQRGVLRIGEFVEIRPGIVRMDTVTKKKTVTPLISRVVSLFSETHPLETAVPGGLIAVGLKLDPTITGKDKLVGQVAGRVGELPAVLSAIEVQYSLMHRVVGDTDAEKISQPKLNEELYLTIGSAGVEGTVIEVVEEGKKKKKKGWIRGKVKVSLNLPVCAEIGDKISLSRKHSKRWRLIGWGEIVASKRMPITFDM